MGNVGWEDQLPCRNPNCKSHGSPHPNCQCYAEGGSVCAQGKSHEENCQYYAEGGEITPISPPPINPQENTKRTLGMAAITHGLSGLLSQVGKSKLQDPKKHEKFLSDFQSQHENALQEAPETLKETKGVKLAHSFQDQDYEKAASQFSEHRLSGSASKKHLPEILKNLHPGLMNREVHPEALIASVEYLDSSMKGQKELQSKVKELFEKPKAQEKMKINQDSIEKLKGKLEEFETHPLAMMDVGGSLGHYLPDHQAQLSYQIAITERYLHGLKPKKVKPAPLDEEVQIDPDSTARYERQLAIAEHPLSLFDQIKEGNLQPLDVTTIKVCYPGLYESMLHSVGNELIESQIAKKQIPYKARQGLSLFLGQDLDFTQSIEAAQAIMGSSQNAAPESQMQAGTKPRAHSGDKATEVEMKQINKVDEMYETPLEARQIDRQKK